MTALPITKRFKKYKELRDVIYGEHLIPVSSKYFWHHGHKLPLNLWQVQQVFANRHESKLNTCERQFSQSNKIAHFKAKLRKYKIILSIFCFFFIFVQF